MNKKKIRCYKSFENVAPNIYNFPVYFLLNEGWSNISLVTCINCGEIFIIDLENPATKGLDMRKIASNHKCPTCNLLLKDSIRNYPEIIKLPNGQIGTCNFRHYIPSENESIVMEFYEIKTT